MLSWKPSPHSLWERWAVPGPLRNSAHVKSEVLLGLQKEEDFWGNQEANLRLGQVLGEKTWWLLVQWDAGAEDWRLVCGFRAHFGARMDRI